MKLLKKFVNALSSSRTSLSDSLEKLNSPVKRRKTLDNSDDIPHQMIELPIGQHILHLNEQQYMEVRQRAAEQLELILKKCLRLSKKDASKLVASLQQQNNEQLLDTQADTLNIFNCPLIQLPAEIVNPDTQLPRIIVRLMHSFVRRGGFEQEGPFRVEGDKQQLAELVAGISSGFEANGINVDSYPIPVLGAAIKRYIRSIPGFLIPQNTTALLVKLYNLKDNALRTLAIQLVLLTLPYQHAKALSSLNLLLKTCSLQESVHKMSAAALTVCFGPTLFDTGIDLNLVSGVNNLLNELIENYSTYSIVPSALKL